MDYTIGVQVGQGKGRVVDGIDLHVVREGTRGAVQKLGQTFVHQF